jgi:hypothetical protein
MLFAFADLGDWVLRYLLWRNNYFPWRYERFLNYATERNFLRKVGNRYTFLHRMLLEYFAARQQTSGEQQR